MEQPYLYYTTWGDGGSPTPSILPNELQACETYTDNKGTNCPAGTPGLFDIINNEFYTNDLGGTFTVGPDIIL